MIMFTISKLNHFKFIINIQKLIFYLLFNKLIQINQIILKFNIILKLINMVL